MGAAGARVIVVHGATTRHFEPSLNHYIAKPWTKEDLLKVTRHQLTEFVLEQETNLNPYLMILKSERLGEKIRQAPLASDE